MKIKLKGMEEINRRLEELKLQNLDYIKRKQVQQIFNRARRPGGTPIDTRGLVNSLRPRGFEVGYTIEYAPHVEFGHRTRSGGYVKGQHFFKNNIDLQLEIYKDDVEKELKR